MTAVLFENVLFEAKSPHLFSKTSLPFLYPFPSSVILRVGPSYLLFPPSGPFTRYSVPEDGPYKMGVEGISKPVFPDESLSKVHIVELFQPREREPIDTET